MDPQTLALRRACGALWLATLSLMTAFMRTQAPAHRLLLARRIAGNLAMLEDQPCFSTGTRADFARLSMRWSGKANALAPRPESRTGGLAAMIGGLHG